MASILLFLLFLLGPYTVFAPVLTLDVKHLKRGLLSLLVLGIFAFVLHLAKML